MIPATILTAAFFFFVVGAGLRARVRPVRVGRETLIGQTIPAVARIDTTSGKVFIEGEYWNAVSDTPIEAGQPAEVMGVQGLTLNGTSADHVNTGTVDLAGGNLTLNQAGTTPSFLNAGTLTIGAGRTLQVNSGAFDLDADGTLGGTGTLSFSGATWNLTPSFTNATMALAIVMVQP